MVENLKDNFKRIFGEEADAVYFAPGRVNLIGEHTDYNGGNVFPCALTIGTYGAVRKRQDSLVRVYSENFPGIGIVEFDIHEIENRKEHDWANYPKGVIYAFNKAGYEFDHGFEAYFMGNIPNGAGLSSSASIEVLTAHLIKETYGLDTEVLDMVKMSKRAENEFIGVNCGIMDQFAIGMGKKDHAILLDTNTLEYRYAPIILEDASIIIANTNKRRGLAESKYNERRAQCEEALRILQSKLQISALGELSEAQFLEHAGMIEDPVVRKRARHAVFENVRTLKAVKALENNDLEEFGKLMYQSHESLRDDYEVTGVELDTLVELARNVPGVIGSRMTGAGFGGCTVSIVRNDGIERFIDEVGRAYRQRIGYDADFYVVSVGDGAHRIG